MPRKSQKHLFSLPGADLAHIVRLAREDLEQLRGRAIFLTGGTGFFGKWLLGAFEYANGELDLGLRVTVLSRDPAVLLAQYPEVADVPEIQFERGDVASFAAATRRYDFILHAASDTTTSSVPADEAARTRTIVDGTQRTLDLMTASGAQRMLYVSSGAVYGSFVAQPTGAKEADFDAAQALMPYGAAKRQAEELCLASGVDFVSARCFAFLGPYLPLDAHFAAGNFLRDALRGGPILVRGDGTALRSYLHPADLVVWLLRILVQGKRARAYNVGSDEAVTTAQLARHIATTVDPAPAVVIQASQPQGSQNIYLPNVGRARDELQLDIALSLNEVIARTMEFLQSRV